MYLLQPTKSLRKKNKMPVKIGDIQEPKFFPRIMYNLEILIEGHNFYKRILYQVTLEKYLTM